MERLNILGGRFVGFAFRNIGWIVLVVGTMNLLLISGKRRCFGIFLAALHDNFTLTAQSMNVSKTELNWISDTYAFLGYFLMPFSTALILRFADFRHNYRVAMAAAGLLIFTSSLSSSQVGKPSELFLTHTLIHGIGSSFLLSSTPLIVAEYFDLNHRYHVLATTLTSSSTLGGLLFCPIFAMWIRKEGWRETFIHLGILFLCQSGLAAAAFQRKDQVNLLEYRDMDEEEEDEEPDRMATKPAHLTETKFTDKLAPGKIISFVEWEEIKAKPQIVVWLFQRIIFCTLVYNLVMNLTDYARDKLERESSTNEDTAQTEAALIQLVFSLGESLTFVVGTLSGDLLRTRLAFVYLIGSGLMTFFLFFWYLVRQSYQVDLFFAFAVGLTISMNSTFEYACSEEVMKVVGKISYPMTCMAGSIGMLMAPFFSGGVIDLKGYDSFFLVQSFMALICFLLMAIIFWMNRRESIAALAGPAAFVTSTDEELTTLDYAKPYDEGLK